jgi:type IV pilus assembly protein PilC
MIFWIIPTLAPIFQELAKEIPLATKIFLAAPGFLKKFGLPLIFFFILIYFLFRQYLKTPEGKKAFDQTIIKLPLLDAFFKNLYLTRFADNLSTLISAGLPIARALEISSQVVGNEVYKAIILEIQKEVRKGIPMSQTLSHFPVQITPLFVQGVLVGEQTGRLAQVLKNLSQFYRTQMEITLNSLLSLLEPILIVILGIGVGIFIASVLIPLYNIFSGI